MFTNCINCYTNITLTIYLTATVIFLSWLHACFLDLFGNEKITNCAFNGLIEILHYRNEIHTHLSGVWLSVRIIQTFIKLYEQKCKFPTMWSQYNQINRSIIFNVQFNSVAVQSLIGTFTTVCVYNLGVNSIQIEWIKLQMILKCTYWINIFNCNYSGLMWSIM